MPTLRIEKTPAEYERNARWRERTVDTLLTLANIGLGVVVTAELIKLVDQTLLNYGLELNFELIQWLEKIGLGEAMIGLFLSWVFFKLRNHDLAQAAKLRKKQPKL